MPNSIVIGNNRVFESWPLKTVLLLAHVVFGLATIVFAYTFARGSKESIFHSFKYLAVAVTFWTSFHGALDFAVHQGKRVDSWFSGANLVILGASMFSCLLAMALNRHEFLYNASTTLALSLYLVWDIISLRYYKTRSSFWYDEYEKLTTIDFIILFSFMVANVPLIVVTIYPNIGTKFVRFQLTAAEIGASSAGAGGVVLSVQLLFYLIFSHQQKKAIRRRSNELLPIQKGYTLWSHVYDKGNAIIHVERRHTTKRLSELDIDGTIVDLGCGIGDYTRVLLKKATKVIAVDQNPKMLEELRSRIRRSKKLVIKEGIASNLSFIDSESVRGILCCIVVDHLDKHHYPLMFKEAYRILDHGGWLYITDVNPYFELLQQSYAKFIDVNGRIQKIQVYPHRIHEVVEFSLDARFSNPKITEIEVSREDAQKWPDLGEGGPIGFPLIIEYYFEKN